VPARHRHFHAPFQQLPDNGAADKPALSDHQRLFHDSLPFVNAAISAVSLKIKNKYATRIFTDTPGYL